MGSFDRRRLVAKAREARSDAEGKLPVLGSGGGAKFADLRVHDGHEGKGRRCLLVGAGAAQARSACMQEHVHELSAPCHSYRCRTRYLSLAS